MEFQSPSIARSILLGCAKNWPKRSWMSIPKHSNEWKFQFDEWPLKPSARGPKNSELAIESWLQFDEFQCPTQVQIKKAGFATTALPMKKKKHAKPERSGQRDFIRGELAWFQLKPSEVGIAIRIRAKWVAGFQTGRLAWSGSIEHEIAWFQLKPSEEKCRISHG